MRQYLEQIHNGRFHSRAHVVRPVSVARIREREDICGGHVFHKEEIARLQAVAVDDERAVFRRKHFFDEDHDHAALAFAVLPRTEDVAVPQDRDGNADEVVETEQVLFARKFADAVWGQGLGGMRLRRGEDVRGAIERAARGGEDDFFDAMFFTGVQEGDGAEDVRLGAADRILDGLRYARGRGLMRDRIRLFFGEYLVHGRIMDIYLIQRNARRKILFFSGGKVVKDRDSMAAVEQLFNDMGSDESGAARDENFHNFESIGWAACLDKGRRLLTDNEKSG